MAEETKCPHCGKPVPPGTPGGLCPECMVKVGIGSEAGTAAAGSKRPAPAPPSPEAIAQHFPQLEIIELLGSGGMGAVYKARQQKIDRLVALKILPSEAAGDPGFAERFTREARALARLNHPNIVALYHFGHVNGLHYFIMEYVDGLNLRQLEQAGRLSPREALQIIPQICEALQFAHDEGIVHRDIKPENVLLDKKGRVKIADFGLARILGHEPEDFRLTRAREVMGTPHYMAPEQVEKPQSVDHRADIYSLGVVFYEMLTGELPLGKFLPPSQKVQIDVRLDDVVLRALEKEPGRRYQHASEVKTDMETILTQPPASASGALPPFPGSQPARARRSRALLVAGAAAVLALAGILAWAWKRANERRLVQPAVAFSGAQVRTSVATDLAGVPREKVAEYVNLGIFRQALALQEQDLLRLHTESSPIVQSVRNQIEAKEEARKQLAAAYPALLAMDVADGRDSTRPALATNAGGVQAVKAPGFDWYLGNRLFATNAGEAQTAQQAFTRRYGLAPPAPSPGVPDGPEQAFARRYGLRPSAPPSATNASSSIPSRANGTAPTVSAQTSPEEAAVNEAVYRQANRITLGQRLAEARAAQERRAFASSAKLYDDAWGLVLRIGPGVDAERDQTITGLTAVRMELARAAQSHGDYKEARTQVDDVLRVDPTSAMAIEFKNGNEKLLAEQRGRIPSEEVRSQVPAIMEERVKASTLVQDGKLLFEMDKLDEADAKLKMALKQDPHNEAALYYLNLVSDAKYVQAEKKHDYTNGSTPLASSTNVNFSVSAAGTNPITYQWYRAPADATNAAAPGPEGLAITKLTPLYLKLTLENVISSDSGPRYVIGVQQEAAASPKERAKRQYYCSLDTSGSQDTFTLREAKAPPNDPTNVTLVLELKDSGERIALSRDHPFQRLEGYMADLEYAGKHQIWINRRAGSVITFGGDNYEIIAVTRTEVLLRQKSTDKKWMVKYDGEVGE
jgi:tRNA A-37 threonylcarbamoyl transferase component Bud32/tetratricopeptide (TPR) repeat protein